MPINIGTSGVGAVYVGDQAVSAVYAGDDLVWTSGSFITGAIGSLLNDGTFTFTVTGNSGATFTATVNRGTASWTGEQTVGMDGTVELSGTGVTRPTCSNQSTNVTMTITPTGDSELDSGFSGSATSNNIFGATTGTTVARSDWITSFSYSSADPGIVESVAGTGSATYTLANTPGADAVVFQAAGGNLIGNPNPFGASISGNTLTFTSGTTSNFVVLSGFTTTSSTTTLPTTSFNGANVGRYSRISISGTFDSTLSDEIAFSLASTNFTQRNADNSLTSYKANENARSSGITVSGDVTSSNPCDTLAGSFVVQFQEVA